MYDWLLLVFATWIGCALGSLGFRLAIMIYDEYKRLPDTTSIILPLLSLIPLAIVGFLGMLFVYYFGIIALIILGICLLCVIIVLVYIFEIT